MSNLYSVDVDVPNSYTRHLKFYSNSLPEAYETAASSIIDKCDDFISDESCNLLDKATMSNWDKICDKVFDIDSIDISDVNEIDED